MNVIGEGPLSADDRAALRELVGTGQRHNALMSPPLLLSELAGLLDAADERDRLAAQVERIEELATNAGYLIDGFDGLQVGAVLADDILRALDGADDGFDPTN